VNDPDSLERVPVFAVVMMTPLDTSHDHNRTPDHTILPVYTRVVPVETTRDPVDDDPDHMRAPPETDPVLTIDPVKVDPVLTVPEDKSVPVDVVVPVQESRDPVLLGIVHEPLLISIDPVLTIIFQDAVVIPVQSSSLVTIERTTLSR
jgi:hypothetical protein